MFFLPIDPRDEEHKDPEEVDLTQPRRAQYLHSAWKKHEDAVFCFDINLAIRKGFTFYQTRSNAIILQGSLPAYCIPKVVRLKTGEVLYEKSHMSPRPPPKISVRHDQDWTRGKVQLGSTVEQQPTGKVVLQSRGEVAALSKLTQPKPNPISDRSGQPDRCVERSGQPDDLHSMSVVKRETTRSLEIEGKGFHERLFESERSGQPDEVSENSKECISEIKEEDIDFNTPGLPHSTVKQLHGANVRKLIQKIENHPHRQALQQSRQFNPFSEESKELIHEVGNIELCELLDVETKAQCKVCLSYWDIGIVYCTCGHFLRNENEDNKRFVKYTMDLLSIPYYYITKGRTHGHRYGKKPGDRENYIANSLKKKYKKKNYLGTHDRFVRDETFRKNMYDAGRDEEMLREMGKLADEDHTHHLTSEEFETYSNIWWLRSNTIGSDTMPVRHRPDFKQALSALRQLKSQEEAAYQQRWQSSSSFWWSRQGSWWTPYSYEDHQEDFSSAE